jgi:hypothetical protein
LLGDVVLGLLGDLVLDPLGDLVLDPPVDVDGDPPQPATPMAAAQRAPIAQAGRETGFVFIGLVLLEMDFQNSRCHGLRATGTCVDRLFA